MTKPTGLVKRALERPARDDHVPEERIQLRHRGVVGPGRPGRERVRRDVRPVRAVRDVGVVLVERGSDRGRLGALEQAHRLRPDRRGGGEPVSVGLGVQRGVRNRVPDQEREPRRHLVAGQLEGRALRGLPELGELDERRRREHRVQNGLDDLVGRPRRGQVLEPQEAGDFRGGQGPAEGLATEGLDGARQAGRQRRPGGGRGARREHRPVGARHDVDGDLLGGAEVAIPLDVRQGARGVVGERRGRRHVSVGRQRRHAEQVLHGRVVLQVSSGAESASSPGCLGRRRRSCWCTRGALPPVPPTVPPVSPDRRYQRCRRNRRTSGVAGTAYQRYRRTGTSGSAGARTSGAAGTRRRGAAANLPSTGGQAGANNPKDAKRPTRLDGFIAERPFRFRARAGAKGGPLV